MVMDPTALVLLSLRSDATPTLGHVGPTQRSSLVPFFVQLTRADFIFPKFPFARLVSPVRPVSLGFDSFSITIMSGASSAGFNNVGDRSPPSSSSQLTPEQQALMLLQTQMQQLQVQLAAQQAAAAAHPPPGHSGVAPVVPAAAPSFRPKIKEPSLYAGDPQK